MSEASEDKKRLAAIEGMFNVANKIYACPVCLRSHTSFYSLEEHLFRKKKREKDGPHGKLMEEELSAFHSNYETAVEWSANGELRSQTHRASAFEIKFIIEHRSCEASNSIEMMIQNYLDIAQASGMHYVCPLCVDKSFEYFNTMDLFRDHCQRTDDQKHQNLKSNDPRILFPAYKAAMNRSGDEKLTLKRNPSGPISYHLSFAIDEVFRERRLISFLSPQITNLS